MITKNDIKTENLTTFGSMNLIMQIMGGVNEDEVHADQYQPRRNRVYSGEFTNDKNFKANVRDTIERLKIGQQLLQDWLDGKIDNVYYFDVEKLQG